MIKKILTSELTYSVIAFSLYLGIFLNLTSAIYFATSFLLTVFSIFYFKFLDKFVIAKVLIFALVTTAGFYLGNLQEVVGVLLGTSVAGFMLSNKLERKVQFLSNCIKLPLAYQVLFSFFYFYKLIIEDVRGQNKLDEMLVFYSVLGFVILLPLTQFVVKKLFYKRLDLVSYTNILLLATGGISLLMFFYPFIEIGSFNTVLPSISSLVAITLVVAFIRLKTVKDFKLKRTLSTLIFSGLPLFLALHYPWNISKYLGAMFAALSLVLFLPKYTFNGKINKEVLFRSTNIVSFTANIYLFLVALFSLSSKGFITRLNIAKIDYLIMVIFGIFLIMFLEDIRQSVDYTLKRLNLVTTYSVVMTALAAFFAYFVLDTGGVEALGSLIFGVLGFIFIKNNFSYNPKLANSHYTYLENNLLNLLTVLSLVLVLVKI